MVKEIVVIGSGGAGMTAASSARKADEDVGITVLTEDTDIAYSPCVLPWAIEGRVRWDNVVMRTPDHYARKNINVLTKTKADLVDDIKKTVSAGGKTYRYDSLVIATGGKVFIPPIEGIGLDGVFVIRTVEDGKKVQAFAKNVKKIAVCGAGVIGLEVALAFSRLGKDVTVIEMMNQVIPRLADKDMADPIQGYLQSKGIKFMLNSPVQSVNGTGHVTGVTAGDTECPCEMVIFSTGVRSNLEIPKQIGLDIGKLGGVLVSPSLNPYKNGIIVPDIFVAGDLIQCESAAVQGPAMSQLGSSAVRQGGVAGRNAAGKNLVYGPVASPWVSAMDDIEIAGTGISTSLAAWYKVDVVIGKAEGLTRARYYPDSKKLTVKLIADAATHRLIGAQIVAGEGATGRINWLTSAIISGLTAEDLLIRSENAYCPPTSMVKDVVISAMGDLCKNFKAT